MKAKDKEQLKLEIDHIFQSGANEMRIFEMVVNFIDSRKVMQKEPSNEKKYDNRARY